MKDSLVHEAAADSAMMHQFQDIKTTAIAETLQQGINELREEVKKIKDEMKVLRQLTAGYYEKGMTIP